MGYGDGEYGETAYGGEAPEDPPGALARLLAWLRGLFR